MDVSNDPLTMCTPSNYRSSKNVHVQYSNVPHKPGHAVYMQYTERLEQAYPRGGKPTLCIVSLVMSRLYWCVLEVYGDRLHPQCSTPSPDSHRHH